MRDEDRAQESEATIFERVSCRTKSGRWALRKGKLGRIEKQEQQFIQASNFNGTSEKGSKDTKSQMGPKRLKAMDNVKSTKDPKKRKKRKRNEFSSHL